MKPPHDIRREIFRKSMGRLVTGALTAEADGVLSGLNRASNLMKSLGPRFTSDLADGATLAAGQEIARLTGNPLQIAVAEERVIGALSKSSGIATAARRARVLSGSRFQVVSGGWKKMPLEIKDMVRQAARDGGIDVRVSEKPFVYLDKNYVRILGGVTEAVKTALPVNRTIVVQIRGETSPVEEEAIRAVRAGATVVMVDTGRREHLQEVSRILKQEGVRSQVLIVFAGNISLGDLESLYHMDVDIVDIGYAIVDAPCLPIRFDVVAVA